MERELQIIRVATLNIHIQRNKIVIRDVEVRGNVNDSKIRVITLFFRLFMSIQVDDYPL